MKSLLVVHHSRTGAARQMAQAATAAAGAEEGVEVHCVDAEHAGPDDLLAADGYLFACPENLAAMSGQMKEFFDRAYYSVLGRVEGRPYALLISAGSDGTNAVRQIERIVTGWRLKRVAEPVIVNMRAQTPEAILAEKTVGDRDLDRCRELGATLAAGLALGVF